MPPSTRRGLRTSKVTAYIEEENAQFIEGFRKLKGLPTTSAALNAMVEFYRQQAASEQSVEQPVKAILERQIINDQKLTMLLVLMYRNLSQTLTPAAIDELGRILAIGELPKGNPAEVRKAMFADHSPAGR